MTHVALAANIAALLAGCGAERAAVVPAAMTQSGSPAFAHRGGSWMLPEAKSENLLYVTTDFSGIDVLEYPSGKFVGAITNYGPGSPEGLCTDRAGNVFVTGQSKIVEFAHGGLKPIATLYDYGASGDFYPSDCAIDPIDGNLAATDLDSTYVAVFPHARGNHPKHYYAADAVMYQCGYDSAGNLFTDQFRNHRRRIGELPAGSSTFEDVQLSQYIGTPGAIEWDGTYLAIEGFQNNTVYRVRVSGSTGTVVGTVALLGATFISSFVLMGSTLVGVDQSAGDVGYWKYPAGGKPFKVISGFNGPLFSTISLAKRAPQGLNPPATARALTGSPWRASRPHR